MRVFWIRFVEFCIFLSVCFFLRLQVAAVYKDPSVGNLINIVIVKLIVIHNEQVCVVWNAGASYGEHTGGLVRPPLSNLAGAGRSTGVDRCALLIIRALTISQCV